MGHISNKSKIFRAVMTASILLFFGPILSLLLHNTSLNDIVTRSGESVANTSPKNIDSLLSDPTSQFSSIQVYAARTWGLKGALAVHTWISTKRKNSSVYRTFQIIGWRYLYGKHSPLVVTESIKPILNWYGNPATLLVDLKGNQFETVIDAIENVIRHYPYRNTYTLWPGPNSNTFTAYVARQIPALALDLPATAIGKDYRPITNPIGLSPSGTGIQANILGIIGLTIARQEGIELNILSLNFELDVFDLAIEIPGVGRLWRSPVHDAQ